MWRIPVFPCTSKHKNYKPETSISENSCPTTIYKPLPDVRVTCQRCGRRRSLYCYDCVIPTLPFRQFLGPERINLPIKIHIVLHPQEKRSKATSIHCPIVCHSETVSLQTYAHLPACVYKEPKSTLLIYPTKTAVPLVDIENVSHFHHAIVIDSTWSQSRSIVRDESLQALPHHIRLQDYKTMFWRYQNCGDYFLATIEAIYYFLREFTALTDRRIYKESLSREDKKKVRLDKDPHSIPSNYDGRYENLLLIFFHQYSKIQAFYKEEGQNRTFTKRHILGDSYIRR